MSLFNRGPKQFRNQDEERNVPQPESGGVQEPNQQEQAEANAQEQAERISQMRDLLQGLVDGDSSNRLVQELAKTQGFKSFSEMEAKLDLGEDFLTSAEEQAGPDIDPAAESQEDAAKEPKGWLAKAKQWAGSDRGKKFVDKQKKSALLGAGITVGVVGAATLFSAPVSIPVALGGYLGSQAGRALSSYLSREKAIYQGRRGEASIASAASDKMAERLLTIRAYAEEGLAKAAEDAEQEGSHLAETLHRIADALDEEVAEVDRFRKADKKAGWIEFLGSTAGAVIGGGVGAQIDSASAIAEKVRKMGEEGVHMLNGQVVDPATEGANFVKQIGDAPYTQRGGVWDGREIADKFGFRVNAEHVQEVAKWHQENGLPGSFADYFNGVDVTAENLQGPLTERTVEEGTMYHALGGDPTKAFVSHASGEYWFSAAKNAGLMGVLGVPSLVEALKSRRKQAASRPDEIAGSEQEVPDQAAAGETAGTPDQSAGADVPENADSADVPEGGLDLPPDEKGISRVTGTSDEKVANADSGPSAAEEAAAESNDSLDADEAGPEDNAAPAMPAESLPQQLGPEEVGEDAPANVSEPSQAAEAGEADDGSSAETAESDGSLAAEEAEPKADAAPAMPAESLPQQSEAEEGEKADSGNDARIPHWTGRSDAESDFVKAEAENAWEDREFGDKTGSEIIADLLNISGGPFKFRSALLQLPQEPDVIINVFNLTPDGDYEEELWNLVDAVAEREMVQPNVTFAGLNIINSRSQSIVDTLLDALGVPEAGQGTGGGPIEDADGDEAPDTASVIIEPAQDMREAPVTGSEDVNEPARMDGDRPNMEEMPVYVSKDGAYRALPEGESPLDDYQGYEGPTSGGPIPLGGETVDLGDAERVARLVAENESGHRAEAATLKDRGRSGRPVAKNIDYADVLDKRYSLAPETRKAVVELIKDFPVQTFAGEDAVVEFYMARTEIMNEVTDRLVDYISTGRIEGLDKPQGIKAREQVAGLFLAQFAAFLDAHKGKGSLFKGASMHRQLDLDYFDMSTRIKRAFKDLKEENKDRPSGGALNSRDAAPGETADSAKEASESRYATQPLPEQKGEEVESRYATQPLPEPKEEEAEVVPAESLGQLFEPDTTYEDYQPEYPITFEDLRGKVDKETLDAALEIVGELPGSLENLQQGSVDTQVRRLRSFRTRATNALAALHGDQKRVMGELLTRSAYSFEANAISKLANAKRMVELREVMEGVVDDIYDSYFEKSEEE